jgi:hypothetical protein
MRPNFKFYDLQSRDGSHYLLENGELIARFNELCKAEAVHARYVSDIAAMYERNVRALLNPVAEYQPSTGAISKTGCQRLTPEKH